LAQYDGEGGNGRGSKGKVHRVWHVSPRRNPQVDPDLGSPFPRGLRVYHPAWHVENKAIISRQSGCRYFLRCTRSDIARGHHVSRSRGDT
jgi:hypothetical protein